jgi:hypothetical protein
MSNNNWYGEAPSNESTAQPTEWIGEAPSQSTKWLGEAPTEQKPQPKQKSTAVEDVQQAGKNFIGSMITQSSMAAAGAMELAKKLPFMDEAAMTEYQDKIFQNMETGQQAVEDVSGGSTGKDPGLGGTVTTMGLQMLPMLAGGGKAAPLIIERMLTEPFTNQVQKLMQKTGGDIETSTRVAAIESLSNVLDASMVIPGPAPLRNIIFNAVQNPLIGFKTREAIESYLSQLGYADLSAEYDPYDINTLLAEGIVGGAIPTVVSLSERMGGTKSADQTIREEADAMMAAWKKKQEMGVDVDASKITAPQYLGRTSNARAKVANAYNEHAATFEGDRGQPYLEQVPGDRNLELLDGPGKNQPTFLNPDDVAALQQAEAQANRSAQAKSNLPQAVDVTMGMVPKMPDVDESGVRSAFMSPDELARAQEQVTKGEEPAHSYMEIPEEARYEPYWPDKALEAAKAKANKQADTTSPTERSSVKSQTQITKYPKDTVNRVLDKELRKVKNIKDAVGIVRTIISDPDIKKIADVIYELAGKTDNFFVLNPEEVNNFKSGSPVRELLNKSVALHLVNETTGRKNVAIRSNEFRKLGLESGTHIEPVLHEAAHNVTEHAFLLANDPKYNKLPKYKNHIQYANDVEALRQAILNEFDIPDRFAPAFENASELNAYGWTKPEFRDWLKQVNLQTYGRNAWQQFLDAIKRLFGSKTQDVNALAKIDSFLERVVDIQQYDRTDVGDAVSRALDGAYSVKHMKGNDWSKDIFKAVKDKIQADKLKYYATAADLLKEHPIPKEISAFRKYVPMTVNQKVEFLEHPYLKFYYDKVREIYNQMDVRANYNKAYLEDITDLIKHKRKDALTILKTLADIQNPELKEARKQAEDTNTREQLLIQQGMPENLVPQAIKILDTMKKVGQLDQELAAKAFGHNWHLEPMYFPREHTGPYTVTVKRISDNGSEQILHMQPFTDSASATKMKQALAEAAKQDSELVVSLERNEGGTLGDVYTMLMLGTNKLPDFLKEINNKLLEEVEVAKRRFEMERSSENITGYLGEKIGVNRELDNRLLKAIERRLDQSYELETRARIITEIKQPLLDNPSVDWSQSPLAFKWLHNLVARELGLDISQVQVAEKSLDNLVNEIGKGIDKTAGYFRGYKGGEVSIFHPREVDRLARHLVWTMSFFKLTAAPPVLLANFSTALLTPADGFRTAFREGINPTIAYLAFQKMLLSDFVNNNKTQVEYKNGKMYTTPITETRDWLLQAHKEGMIEARISDPLQLSVTNTTSKIERVLNSPRDSIEKLTNIIGQAYYFNFYRLAYPDLDPNSREFKTKVYEAVRSWTGDYTQQAEMLGFTQAGHVGTLQSNFAKWKYNQLGRLFNDISMLKKGNPMPFAMTMLMTIFMAGAVGAPIMAEYEALRRFGIWSGWWDIPPLAGAMHEGADKLKEIFGKNVGDLAHTMVRGPMNDMFDSIDLSNNLRYSSVLDVNTLAPKFIGELAGASNTLRKEVLQLMGFGPGANWQELREATKGMPTVVGNVVDEYIKSKRIPPDKNGMYTEQFSKLDAGSFKITPEEKAMAYAGFKSKRINDESDAYYYEAWKTRKDAKLVEKNTKLIQENLDAPARNSAEQIDKLVKEIVEVKGPKGIAELVEKIKETRKSRNLSVFERGVLEALRESDPYKRSKKFNSLKQYQPAQPLHTYADR